MYAKAEKRRVLSLMVSILAIGLVIYELLILKNIIPRGYYITIYNQVPSRFWYTLIFVYFLGVLLVLRNKNRDLKRIGVFILLINYLLFLIIFYQLGYYISDRQDDLTYLGEIKSIINTGHIGSANIYPALHNFYAIISMISNVQPNVLALLLPSFFSLIFVIGIFIFSRIFIKNINARYLLVPVSLIYYFGRFHFSIAPHYSFYTIMPIVLFILHKYLENEEKNRLALTWVLLIFSVVAPFSHPFIFILFLWLLIFFALKMLLKKDVRSLRSISLILLSMISLGLVSLVSNSYLRKLFVAHYITFTKGTTQTLAERGSTSLLSAIHTLSLLDFLKFISLEYGRYFIPMFFILLAIIIIVKERRMKAFFMSEYKKLFFLLLILGLLDAFFIFNPFLVHVIERMTSLNYFIYAQIPLFVLSLYFIFLKERTVKSVVIATGILVLILSLSLYGACASPSTFKVNKAITYNEVIGMRWIFDKKGAAPIAGSILNSQNAYRFRDLFFGPWGNYNPENIITYNIIPDHFRYEESKEFRYDHFYVTIMGYDEIAHLKVIKKIREPKFNSSDFEMFRNNPNVIKIYSSLNIEVYDINYIGELEN